MRNQANTRTPAGWLITRPAQESFLVDSRSSAFVTEARDKGWKVDPVYTETEPAKDRWHWLVIQLFASVITLAGIHFGSTTALGASLYLVALAFWFWLCFGQRLWGLMPLNLASTILSAANLWKALAA